jgi:hypothetical protein
MSGMVENCDPHRDIPRTLDRIIDSLAKLNAAGELPDLSVVPGFGGGKKNSKMKKFWKG